MNALTQKEVSRRSLLKYTLFGMFALAGGASVSKAFFINREKEEAVFTARVPTYESNIKENLTKGYKELGLTEKTFHGKKIFLKPNIVEAFPGTEHVVTHPSVIRAAAESFLDLNAKEVIVAEGTAHRKDMLYCLEQTGILDALTEDRLPFVDLNTSDVFKKHNSGGFSKIESFWLPDILNEVDMIVSVAKMKTHHWAGVTLSMKNLFGLMPGNVYGYPKNVLHFAGIPQAVLDINATVKPDLAIVDGIIGMEGDGPLMGTPVKSGVLVMGRNCAAVDATCSRIMGINPEKIPYLRASSGRLGTIHSKNIIKKGHDPETCRTDFRLEPYILAHQGIRLA